MPQGRRDLFEVECKVEDVHIGDRSRLDSLRDQFDFIDTRD